MIFENVFKLNISSFFRSDIFRSDIFRSARLFAYISFFKYVLILFLIFDHQVYAQSKVIQIQNKATIQKAKILLVDIAKWTGFSETEIASYGAFEIAPAPITGTIQQFPKQFLQDQLKALNLPSDIVIKYPQILSVTKENKVVTAEFFTQELTTIIKERFAQREIAELKMPNFKTLVFTDDQSYQWFIEEQKQNQPGVHLKITQQWFKNDQPSQADVFFVSLHFFLQVPVLSEKVMPGKNIQTHQVSFLKIKDLNLPQDVILDASDLYSAQVKQLIPLSQPIHRSMLNLPIIVKRGDRLEVLFQKKGISLVIQGEAMTQARKGDRIQIKNISSQKIISAKVISSSQAIIE